MCNVQQSTERLVPASRPVFKGRLRDRDMKFSELVRLLEREGFELVKEKGSIRYYRKEGIDNLIRVDYHGNKEVQPGLARLARLS